jgi:thermitase
MKKLLISIVLLAALLLSTWSGFAAAQGPNDTPSHAPDRILVKFKPGTPENTRASVNAKLGGRVVETIPGIDVQVVSVPKNTEVEKIGQYKKDRNVEFAEPDYVATAILTPDDHYFRYQWGMTKIQAPDAWSVTTGSSAIDIAILDTGIDQDHEDLAAKIVANKNFTLSRTVDDLYGHGTHVAGIAAAITNNAVGVAGVGFNTKLMNVKVLNDSGSGYYSWIANGITWAANNGAKVINMSLGGTSSSSTLESAINYAWSKGVVIVAAAGNNGNTAPVYPAYYPNCIAVAATDQNDARASFSSYGNWVDVAAPGDSIYSTLPNHNYKIGGISSYGVLSGTSMAAPHVAGLAGLVWSTSYGTDNASVRSRIESTADAISGTGTYWHYGRINAYEAVAPSSLQPASLSVSVTSPSLTNVASFAVQATVSNSGDDIADNVMATIVLPAGLNTVEDLAKSLGDIAGKALAIASWEVTASADGQYTIGVDATATNASTASSTAATTVDTTPPDQVTGLSVAPVSNSQLNLTWTANTEPDFNHYSVYRSSTSGGPYTLIASPQSNAYPDTGLSADTTYYYVVSAVDNADNEGMQSTETAGTTNSASVNKMRVESIDMELNARGAFTYATATVTVVDAGGNPVPGATVSGHWSVATSDSDSGLTDNNGQVSLASDRVKRPSSGTIFTFTVDNIQLIDWTYDWEANATTTESITVY